MRDQIAVLERRIGNRDTGPSGPIRLTAPDAVSEYLLPDILAEVYRESAGMTIDLVVSNQVLSLAQGAADIALRITGSPAESLRGRRVGTVAMATQADDVHDACTSSTSGRCLLRSTTSLLRCNTSDRSRRPSRPAAASLLLPNDPRLSDLFRAFRRRSVPTVVDLNRAFQLAAQLRFKTVSGVHHRHWPRCFTAEPERCRPAAHALEFLGREAFHAGQKVDEVRFAVDVQRNECRVRTVGTFPARDGHLAASRCTEGEGRTRRAQKIDVIAQRRSVQPCCICGPGLSAIQVALKSPGSTSHPSAYCCSGLVGT